MKKQVVWPICVVCFISAVVAVMMFNDHYAPDLSEDELPFSKMALPPRKVSGGIYMDGGSVFIRVTDRYGVVYDLAFPFDHHSYGYPKAYHGALDGTSRASTPFKDSSRARVIALDLLYRYGDESEYSKDAYDYLSGQHYSLFGRIKRDGIRGVFK